MVQLIGRINKCGVVSPRFDLAVRDIEKQVNNLLPSRQFGHILLTTSSGIMDHEEARRKHTGGKILGVSALPARPRAAAALPATPAPPPLSPLPPLSLCPAPPRAVLLLDTAISQGRVIIVRPAWPQLGERVFASPAGPVRVQNRLLGPPPPPPPPPPRPKKSVGAQQGQ